jgi:hypothetical protein
LGPFEIDEPGELALNADDVLLDRRAAKKQTLGGASRRVAIMAVPPPTTITGIPPLRCKWMRPKIGTRWPMCREDPVGSNPL